MFYAGFVTDCQENHYGLKGSSIQLSISPRNQSHQQDSVKWRRFNRRDFLGDKDGVPPRFKKRMSLNDSDWSLTIHNLQEDDSGLYEALSKHEDETLAAFTLKVESKIYLSHLTLYAYNMIYIIQYLSSDVDNLSVLLFQTLSLSL